MARLRLPPALLFASCLLAGGSHAAIGTSDPHASLQFFVGTWTVKGSEATYTESCEWLSRQSFVICKAQDTDPKDPGISLSIFGYSPEDHTYTYAGYDGAGSSRSLRGWFNGGYWVFTGQRERGATSPRWQVTITPTETGFHFLQQTSVNGAEWSKSVEVDYLRIKKRE